MFLLRKKKGKSIVLSSGFGLFDSGAEELRSNFSHLSNEYARIVMLSARLLNYVNKIRETEL